MPSYLIRRPAADYAQMLAELRGSSTLHGRPVESWRETASDDGLTLYVSVTYEPLVANREGSIETFTFPALGVLALEGKRG
jgi:hypothetical protein